LQILPSISKKCIVIYNFTGLPFGSAAAMIVSGSLIQAFGWPSVFWIVGLLASLWLCLWMNFVYSSPSTHTNMSAEEFKYIESSLGDSSDSKKLSDVKFLRMRTNIF